MGQDLPAGCLSHVELSAEALLHNLASFRQMLRPDTRLAAVVKANAYGHGLEEVCQILDGRVDCFQVDDIEELRRVRRISQTEVLLLGYVADADLEEALRLGCTLAAYAPSRIAALGRLGERLGIRPRVHATLDCLLGRDGILPGDLEGFLDELERHPAVELTGAYAHFATIEDTSDFSHSQRQVDAYAQALDLCGRRGWSSLARHISATSGIMAYEAQAGREGGSSLVRLGIGLYGLWPSRELRARFGHGGLELRPALRWVSHLAQVKELPAHHPVGYGLTYVTSRPTRIAVVPQGYSDGYDRGLSSIGEVLVGGRRCPVLGRISMNMLSIDVSGVPEAAEGDEAVLLGSQLAEEVPAEELAQRLSTINYEVVARISPLLPRQVVHLPS